MACVSNRALNVSPGYYLYYLVKARRIAWLLLLIVAFASLMLGYRWWGRRANGPRIIVEADATDIPTLQGASTLDIYDPNFNRVNFVRAINLPITNSLN